MILPLWFVKTGFNESNWPYILFGVTVLKKMANDYSILVQCRPEGELYSDPCQTSRIEVFAKIVYSLKLSTVFVKSSNLDVWQGSEYTSKQPK